MQVQSRKINNKNSAVVKRSSYAIQYALKQIKESPVAPYVTKLLLFGSCARREQTFSSDVDLLLEVSENITEDFRIELVKLRSIVTPIDVDAPKVDLRIVIGNAWEKNPMLYYKNIRRDGIDIWNQEETEDFDG